MLQVDRALQGAAAQAALGQAAVTSVASVVLADPGQQPNAGVVLSFAPLLGAGPQVDRSHPRWLHVHVRPHVRGLLKLLKVLTAWWCAWVSGLYQFTLWCDRTPSCACGNMNTYCRSVSYPPVTHPTTWKMFDWHA